jgi:hypothetical protein
LYVQPSARAPHQKHPAPSTWHSASRPVRLPLGWRRVLACDARIV